MIEAAEAALAAPQPSPPPRPVDLLLDGLAIRYAEGYAAGLPMLERALHAFRHDRGHDEENGRWLWLACLVAQDICERTRASGTEWALGSRPDPAPS